MYFFFECTIKHNIQLNKITRLNHKIVSHINVVNQSF
jgi:hypothetical protein